MISVEQREGMRKNIRKGFGVMEEEIIALLDYAERTCEWDSGHADWEPACVASDVSSGWKFNFAPAHCPHCGGKVVVKAHGAASGTE